MNITILAALFAMIFGRLLGRWRGAVMALIGIAIYTVLVGAEAGVALASIYPRLGIYGARIEGRGELRILQFPL